MNLRPLAPPDKCATTALHPVAVIFLSWVVCKEEIFYKGRGIYLSFIHIYNESKEEIKSRLIGFLESEPDVRHCLRIPFCPMEWVSAKDYLFEEMKYLVF